jgi:hypothetical protein
MDTQVIGRTRRFGTIATFAIVLGASVAGGVAAGVLGATTGLPFAILFAVMFPAVSILVWQFVLSRPSALDEAFAPGAHTVLLDARATWSRLVQVVGPLAGTLLGAVGIAQLVREGGGGAWAGPVAVAGAILILATLMYSISWEVSYKGHRIRFQNHPCLAERLFVDGRIVDRGKVGVLNVLFGTIEAGEGAGDLITAISRAGFSTFSCRITAGPAAQNRST